MNPTWFADITVWPRLTRAAKQQLRDHYRKVVRPNERTPADRQRILDAHLRRMLRNRKRLRNAQRCAAGQ